MTWQYGNAREYLSHAAHGPESLPPLIVTVAITGGVQGQEANEAIPETPEEQAQSTYEAWNAGASVVHVHARRAEDPGMMAHDTARYVEANSLIRERCPDIVINNTMTGDVVDTRDGHCRFEWGSVRANPEIVAVDCGPIAYRMTLRKREPPLAGRDHDIDVDDVFVTTFGELEALVDELARLRIKPEFELFNSGQFTLLDELIKRPSVAKPYLVQFVLGAQNANYATPMDLMHMVERLPADSVFSTIGIGAQQLPLGALAIVLGGHVRVGLEDSVYVSKGRKAASNAELVERVVTLAEVLGRPVATPAQARDILGLSSEPSRYTGAEAAARE